MRDISKVLLFRYDISPFLIHLTRDTDDGQSAKDHLISILTSRTLKYGKDPISVASFGYPLSKLNKTTNFYFSAISFTETPLGEAHNLLEIGNRSANFKAYGLVLLKENLMKKGVSPVLYINNIQGDKDKTIQALCNLIDSRATKNAAANMLPYIAVFGEKLSPLGGTPQGGTVDFTWEREWRYASRSRLFVFEKEDVFIGLCPDNEIDFFESKFKKKLGIDFIDPQRNMKWYAEKLVTARQRSDLKYSVV
jgi:hypothetical protein